MKKSEIKKRLDKALKKFEQENEYKYIITYDPHAYEKMKEELFEIVMKDFYEKSARQIFQKQNQDGKINFSLIVYLN